VVSFLESNGALLAAMVLSLPETLAYPPVTLGIYLGLFTIRLF